MAPRGWRAEALRRLVLLALLAISGVVPAQAVDARGPATDELRLPWRWLDEDGGRHALLRERSVAACAVTSRRSAGKAALATGATAAALYSQAGRLLGAFRTVANPAAILLAADRAPSRPYWAQAPPLLDL